GAAGAVVLPEGRRPCPGDAPERWRAADPGSHRPTHLRPVPHAPKTRGHSPCALAPAPRPPDRPEAGVTAGQRERPEAVVRFAPGTGSGLSATLRPVIARVEERAAEGLEALILSGSHATGE